MLPGGRRPLVYAGLHAYGITSRARLHGGSVTGEGCAPAPHASEAFPRCVRAGLADERPYSCATTEPAGVPSGHATESAAVEPEPPWGCLPVSSTRRTAASASRKA